MEAAEKFLASLKELQVHTLWKSCVRSNEVDRRLSKESTVVNGLDSALSYDGCPEDVVTKGKQMVTDIQNQSRLVTKLKEFCKILRGIQLTDLVSEVHSPGSLCSLMSADDCEPQPLSHSATQPLRRSGKSGWTSHSATQSLRVAEWLSGWCSGSARVAEWLSGCSSHSATATQPLSNSVTQSGRVAEWSGWSSHSGRVAEWLSGWSSHSGRVSEWSGWSSHSGRVAECLTGPATLGEWVSGRVPEWLSGWSPATLAEWLSDWVAGPATLAWQSGWSSHGRVAEWLSGWSGHSGRVAEWLSGWSSHSGKVAEWLGGWFSFSGRVAEWLSGCMEQFFPKSISDAWVLV